MQGQVMVSISGCSLLDFANPKASLQLRIFSCIWVTDIFLYLGHARAHDKIFLVIRKAGPSCVF